MNNNNIKTPFFIIDKNELDNNFEKFRNSINKFWKNNIISYSYKANSLPWVIKYFNGKGCYSEVVSSDEYDLGILLGIEKNKFIYNGPVKDKDTFIKCIKNNSIVNIDSKVELSWLDDVNFEARVGLRVNFDIEKLCKGESQCGSSGGRFGFCYENGELEKAINYLKERKIKLSGLHLHVSSKTRSLNIYKSIAKIAVKIIDEFNLDLDYVDIGGGFFGGLKDKPQFDEYFDIITKELKKKVDPKKTKLIVEPGMCLIAHPISYVTSVIDVKDTTYGRFVTTDGSRTNIDPLMSKSNYFYKIDKRIESGKILKEQVICGYTCLENDRIFTYKDSKELCVGDRIIYDKVGAYTICLTPLFIQYFPDIYVLDKDKIKLVRKKWTAKQYVQNEL